MTRRFAAALAALTMLVAVPSLALGGQATIYHTISASTAFAVFGSTDDCLRTTVWISSTDGRWAAQPGPATTSGLTSVAIQVTDACGRIAVAAGGGPAPLFDWVGQDFVPLAATPRLTSARVATSQEGIDAVSGDTFTVAIDVEWTAAGSLDADPVRSHVRFPGEVVVNSHDNNLLRPATATATVTIDGQLLALDPTWDASMELVRSGCMEVPWPHFDGFTKWCFGF
jgi:hypothetical protein